MAFNQKVEKVKSVILGISRWYVIAKRGYWVISVSLLRRNCALQLASFGGTALSVPPAIGRQENTEFSFFPPLLRGGLRPDFLVSIDDV
ncbi:MAG: hypothetical protein WBA93_20445 [Microcoleaceae cyanobacterium]